MYRAPGIGFKSEHPMAGEAEKSYMFNPVLAIWRYMINPLCTRNTPMSHHEQGEKLGHQTTCNDRMKMSSLKRKHAHERNQHYSVCILACHLEKLLVADDILRRIPVSMAIRIGDVDDERHTSLVYSRFKDSIHTRTVSWLMVCLDLFVRFSTPPDVLFSLSDNGEFFARVSFPAQCLQFCD
jgi:hypothetical protein